jgi:ATP-binding cassette, subfamily B, multidrug efflux pump
LYLWKYKKLAFFGLFSLLMVDVIEIIPPILLKKAVDLITEATASVSPLPTQKLSLTGGLEILALSYLGIALVQALGRYGWRMYLIRASLLAGRDLREEFAKHIFKLSPSFFDKRRIGDLMSLATHDTEAIRMALGAGLLTLADAFFYFLTIPVAMFILSPRLTCIAFIPLLFVPWFVSWSEKEIHGRFKKVQEGYSKLSAMAQENLNGIRVIKAFSAEEMRLKNFRGLGEEFIQLNLRLSRVQSLFGPVLDFSMSFGLVILLWVGGRSVIEGAVTIGTFVAFQRYIQKMIWPMAAIGHAVSHYQRALASSSRLKNVLAIQSDVPSPLHPVLPKEYSQSGKALGEVEFRNLCFSFPGTSKVILQDICFKIEQGERVAFVGAVGSGKSVLFSLVPRLYPVQKGMIFIDGVDINDWPLMALRGQMGYVAQEVFLFSESVTDNVAIGLDNFISHSDVFNVIEEATQLAAIHEEVIRFIDGYQTRLGERGVTLSGGQKQRLSIARAIAKRPALLILDDALSAVDVEMEEKILSTLRARPDRNTEMIAAHRISTVRDANRIVVLCNGKIEEQGTHRALLSKKSGIYRRFYDEQRMKEDFERYVEEYDSHV